MPSQLGTTMTHRPKLSASRRRPRLSYVSSMSSRPVEPEQIERDDGERAASTRGDGRGRTVEVTRSAGVSDELRAEHRAELVRPGAEGGCRSTLPDLQFLAWAILVSNQ